MKNNTAHNKLLNAIIISALLITFSCARQGAPPGGPVDKIPPLIVGSIPPTQSVNVLLDTDIEIMFSEGINKANIADAIFITPYPGEDVKFKVKGKKLRIELPEVLKPNRTYVFTIGTDVKDLRNNRLQQAFTLAFATGPQIDNNTISGKVYGKDKVEGVLVWAYDLSLNPSPNPQDDPAEYITQCGATGDYELSYLAQGTYRLFAVQDKERDFLYDSEYDALGIANRDVTVSSIVPDVENCIFRITIEDTTRPMLDSASPPDRNHLDVRFSESMAPAVLGRPDS